MGKSNELRAKLDERGIKWWTDKYYRDTNTCWRVGDFEWRASEKKDGKLLIGCTCVKYLTPEQAIAATVGNRTDLSKRLREVNGLHEFAKLFGFSWDDESDWTWHDVACAMADAVDAATVGAGTCKNVSTTGNFRCSECDAADLDFDKPTYCHGCGRKVVT